MSNNLNTNVIYLKANEFNKATNAENCPKSVQKDQSQRAFRTRKKPFCFALFTRYFCRKYKHLFFFDHPIVKKTKRHTNEFNKATNAENCPKSVQKDQSQRAFRTRKKPFCFALFTRYFCRKYKHPELLQMKSL
jgi:hypothetical protein